MLVIQRTCSLFSTRLAGPFCVYSGSRVCAREEANQERLALDLAQAISDFLKKAFGDVVRKDNFAIWLVLGHGGVVWRYRGVVGIRVTGTIGQRKAEETNM
jgi:hypothetical protein